MSKRTVVLKDVERSPLPWKLLCPRCGSSVSAKYMLDLSPMLGIAILPHFYCPCARFQIMKLVPVRLVSFQGLLISYAFITSALACMMNKVFKRGVVA